MTKRTNMKLGLRAQARGVSVRAVVAALCAVYGACPDVRLVELCERARRWS